MADWAEQLRASVCPLWEKKPKLNDLAMGIALVLIPLIGGWTAIVAAIALLIAKYLVDELCEGWEPAS